MADTKIIIDCSTGEMQEIELTPEEIAQREADAIAFTEEQAKLKAEEQAKLAVKEAAHAKLVALGLTLEEISSLTK